MKDKKYITRFSCFPSLIINSVKIVFSIVAFSSLSGCSKEPIDKIESDVIFLGHRGAGNTSINQRYIENTISSFNAALENYEGIETDLQMSLDGTIWLYHNNEIDASSCINLFSVPPEYITIPLMRDREIEQVRIYYNLIEDRIYKFSELIDLWKETPGGFIMSLHIKMDFPKSVTDNPLIGGRAKYLSKLCGGIIDQIQHVCNKNQILIEVLDKTFCKTINKSFPEVKVCLFEEVPFQKQITNAVATGFDGVCCSINQVTLSAPEVQRAKNLGLIVQLWTPDTKEDLIKAINLKPHYIQTNSLHAHTLID